MELKVQRDGLLEGLHSIWSRRRRRLRIGDLLVAVALVALGLSAVAVPVATSGERMLVSVLTVTFLTLILVQWGIAGVSFRRPRPMIGAVLGILSSLTALSAFVGILVLGLVVPQAAALLSLAALLLVVYMTTWD
jgi:hypothetical protein